MRGTEERWYYFSEGFDGAAEYRVDATDPLQNSKDEPLGSALAQIPGQSGGPAQRSACSSDPLDDDELVDLCLQGDSSAFGELVLRYHNMCLRRAILIMRNRSDAEEEVQNAFWKAFQRLVQYRGDGTFSAWLGRIV